MGKQLIAAEAATAAYLLNVAPDPVVMDDHEHRTVSDQVPADAVIARPIWVVHTRGLLRVTPQSKQTARVNDEIPTDGQCRLGEQRLQGARRRDRRMARGGNGTAA